MTDDLNENEIAQAVVDAAYQVHRQLGPGLLESVYEIALALELRERGFRVERQIAVPVKYGSLLFEEGFRIDLLVNDLVIVEVKSIESVIAVHNKRLGLLINFGTGAHQEWNQPGRQWSSGMIPLSELCAFA